MSELTPLGDTEKWINLMLYGDPGVGKTALAGTLAMLEDMRMVWGDIDGGLLTLKDMERQSDIEVFDIEETKQLEDLHRFMLENSDDWQAVVIDNATELVDRDLEAVVRRKATRDVERFGKSRRDNLDDVWLDDQGETKRHLSRILRWFRDLPMHTIFIAHARQITKKRGDQDVVVDVRPDFPRALRRAAEGYCDYVWYMHEIEGRIRLLYTQRLGVIYAKSRGSTFHELPVLQVPWHYPVLPRLLDLLSGEELDEELRYEEPEEEESSE